MNAPATQTYGAAPARVGSVAPGRGLIAGKKPEPKKAKK